jgi:hypothetical protein
MQFYQGFLHSLLKSIRALLQVLQGQVRILIIALARGG